MRNLRSVLVVSFGLFLFGALASAQEAAPPPTTEEAKPAVPTVEELLKRAEDSIAKVNDYSGRMIKWERFEDGVQKTVMEFKFQRPFKVYVKYVTPHKGREAIYKKGWNDGEVKVHKGDFPDLTLNLDTQGGTAMDENHHPITDFGLENTIRITGKNLRKALKRNEGDFKVSDGGTMHGQETWKIEAKLPKGGHFVTAKDDETLWGVAKRTGQDMYLIMYANKDYDDWDDPDEGDKVFVPRYYGGRSELIVSKKTGLPVKVSTWDWSGKLYEAYEYPELKLNPGLGAQDFNPDNKAYDF
jgi:outer membrane lipoprotein-sorting protein